MVTSIGGASATQAAYAATPRKDTEDAAVAASAVAATDTGQAPPAPAVSDESAASARLGEQLNAQADAARVQRAVDESTVKAETSDEAAEATLDAEAATAQAPAGGAAPAGSAGGAGAASAASAEATDTDYIAEADTNADKTVSDDERAVYEAKLREQAEESASKPLMSAKSDPLDAKTAEVRAAYGQDERSAPALEITA